MVIAVILMVCGAFWITSSFINNTKDVASAMFYKVVPFVTGIIAVGIALGMLGVINIPV